MNAPEQDLTKILNLPDYIEYAGKKYEFSQLTLREHAEFSRWLRARAVASACDPETPPDVRKEMLGQITVQAAIGIYDIGGPAFIAALSTVAGQAHALYLALHRKYEECDEEFCRAMLMSEYEKISKQVMENAATAGESTRPESAASPGAMSSASSQEATADSPSTKSAT